MEAEPVLEVGAENSDKAGRCQQASTPRVYRYVYFMVLCLSEKLSKYGHKNPDI